MNYDFNNTIKTRLLLFNFSISRSQLLNGSGLKLGPDWKWNYVSVVIRFNESYNFKTNEQHER